MAKKIEEVPVEVQEEVAVEVPEVQDLNAPVRDTLKRCIAAILRADTSAQRQAAADTACAEIDRVLV
jgi:hypothetical protein